MLLLIIAFTYFYAFIQVNPENIADNLKKQGAYIPGIRPGQNTQNYLTSTLYRLTFVGAIFLAISCRHADILHQFRKPSTVCANWRNKFNHRRRGCP